MGHLHLRKKGGGSMKIKLRWEVSGEADLPKIFKFLVNLGKSLLLLVLLKTFLGL